MGSLHLYRWSYDFEFNLEIICTSGFFKKNQNCISSQGECNLSFLLCILLKEKCPPGFDKLLMFLLALHRWENSTFFKTETTTRKSNINNNDKKLKVHDACLLYLNWEHTVGVGSERNVYFVISIRGESKRRKEFVQWHMTWPASQTTCHSTNSFRLLPSPIFTVVSLWPHVNSFQMFVSNFPEDSLGKNLTEQRREPRKSTHIWRRVWESNPGECSLHNTTTALDKKWITNNGIKWKIQKNE